MPLVANCACTCANHTPGSFGQYGGSFKATAATCDVELEIEGKVGLATCGSMTKKIRIHSNVYKIKR